jgi:hypothetical protein
MAPVEVTSILFKDFVNDGKVPEDNFVVNKEHSIDPESDLKDGQIFLRLLYISVDPYMRTRMRKMEVSTRWAAGQEGSRTQAVQHQLHTLPQYVHCLEAKAPGLSSLISFCHWS